eukprot:INCI8198.1.p1 GENE.INCI8198.1~~INCI8198.1.p1  ORF type:complete len:369 (-),score=65.27 INCI8198.1:29-1135(-)
MAAVVLKDTLEKRGKTAQSWSKRSVTLRQDALEYTHRFVWKTAILDLRDIVEVSEQLGGDDGLCFLVRAREDESAIVDHTFRASTIEQFNAWVSKLKELVAKATLGGGSSAPRSAPQPITEQTLDILESDLGMPDQVDNYDFQRALKKAGLPEFANYPLGARLFQMRCARIGADQLPRREAVAQIAEIQQQDPVMMKQLSVAAYDTDGDGSVSRKEFLDIITRTWYQMFRALSSSTADNAKAQQIVAFAEAKARDLHTTAIETFTALEKQCAGGGQITRETFGLWCEKAKTLRAEADGIGSLAVPMTFCMNREPENVALEDHSFKVTVPQGVSPGDEWEVTAPSGKKVRIIVPEGAIAGATITLSLQR